MWLLLASLTRAYAGDESTVGELSYEGGFSGSAAGYVKGKPVSVSHSGGNLSVRCMDTSTLTARLQYTIYGSAEGPMESMGKGIKLSVTGTSSGGAVKTITPSKPSGVSHAESTLTVNIPRAPLTLTVSQTGTGWVQVIDCDGTVKVTSGSGGLYVSGHLDGVTASAPGGDAKVVQNDDAVFKSTTTLTATTGNATLQIASAQGGKLTASGKEVVSSSTVVGTNSSDLVQGELGVAGPAITVKAANGKVEISANK